MRSKRKQSGLKVKRSGFVYSIYKKNIIALWVLTLILNCFSGYILITSANYLMNYLFYRAAPDAQQLQEFIQRDSGDENGFVDAGKINVDKVLQDIEANGGEMALMRNYTSMFYKSNVYQQGSRYRFQIDLDRDKLVDTGIYYDDAYRAYSGITDRSQLAHVIPSENYATEHLYFYEYAGMDLLLVLDYDLEFDFPEKMRVTFAPMSVYSAYMVKDLAEAGYTDFYNYFIDCRETPVDFEDEDFKDLCMIAPFSLAALICAVLMTAFPTFHPTYRQLNKYGRTIQKAVEKVDADYEEFGIEGQSGKESYLGDWLIRRSTFKTSIEKNYKKQKN